MVRGSIHPSAHVPTLLLHGATRTAALAATVKVHKYLSIACMIVSGRTPSINQDEATVAQSMNSIRSADASVVVMRNRYRPPRTPRGRSYSSQDESDAHDGPKMNVLIGDHLKHAGQQVGINLHNSSSSKGQMPSPEIAPRV